MRRVVALSAIVLFGVTMTSTAQQNTAAPEQEIRSAIQSYFEALNRLDADALDHIETDDYIFIQDGFILDKKTQIAMLREAKKQKPGNLNQKSEGTLHRILNAGDRYIVTGRNKVSDVTDVLDAAFTEVWVRQAGQWRLQHAHYSTSRPPAKK